MKKAILGIHDRRGSFSDRWIEYCCERDIPFKIIDAFSSDLVDRAKGLKAFLWHWPHYDYASGLIARQAIRALEMMGILVFPSTNTCWHFDDKVAQKYLLEAVGAPLAPSWVFYRLEDALDWLARVPLPKVFKLRRGAGSCNVRLVRSRKEANRLCKLAFTRGFDSVAPYFGDLKAKLHRIRSVQNIWSKALRAPKILGTIARDRRQFPRERQYVYFQDYIPGLECDYRIKVVGQRCWGFRRFVRPNDFRASGSGRLNFDEKAIPRHMVELAFSVAEAAGLQSVAFDMVAPAGGPSYILELSYAYCIDPGECHGWWDRNLDWHEGGFMPQDAILEDVLRAICYPVPVSSLGI